MLRHIVMMKFKQAAVLDKSMTEVKEMLIGLTQTVGSLKRMEVGLNIFPKATAYDLVLTADFDNEDGLKEYRTHPDHVKILDHIKGIVEKMAAVDYELND